MVGLNASALYPCLLLVPLLRGVAEALHRVDAILRAGVSPAIGGDPKKRASADSKYRKMLG